MKSDINIGNFDYELKDGLWIYKSADKSILPKKSKPCYQDKPQYKAIEQFESEQKKMHQNMLELTVQELNKYLKDNVNGR